MPFVLNLSFIEAVIANTSVFVVSHVEPVGVVLEVQGAVVSVALLCVALFIATNHSFQSKN